MSGSGSDDSSWDDPPKPLSNGSNGSRAKAPAFEEVKLVPRKANTIIGLGAVKPPGSPLPSPLQGLSSAMARAPGESPPSRGAKAPNRSPTPAPQTTKSAEAPERAKPPASPVPPPPAAAAAPSSSPPPKVPSKPAPASEDDEDGLSKAYLAPTSVPKALLPTNEDDAKVVINIPTPAASNEEVTATIDREALERQRVRDEQLDAQRRREPTQRIPRKAVQEVRREIEERTAREAALEAGVDPSDVVVDSIRAIPSGPPIADEATEISAPPKSRSGRPAAEPAARALDATVTESQLQPDIDEAEPALAAPAKPPSRSMLWVAVAAVVAAGGIGAFFLLGKGSSGGKSTDTPAAQTAQTATKVATPPKATGDTAAPPLQLTADPKTDTPDPNAVHLDAQAADTPSPTAEPTTQPVVPVNPNPPRLPAVKPASTYYTPSDI